MDIRQTRIIKDIIKEGIYHQGGYNIWKLRRLWKLYFAHNGPQKEEVFGWFKQIGKLGPSMPTLSHGKGPNGRPNG